MDACSCWSRRAGDFIPPAKRDRSCSDQRGADLARMIDSSLENYRRIPPTLHSHHRAEAPSAIKDTKSEAWDAGIFYPS